jgi:Protein of unknown function (DUF3604)
MTMILRRIGWMGGGMLPLLLIGCSPYRIYWGDVHGHTANSDGKGSVPDYFAYARDQAKLDFAVVTDHDFGHQAPWRMPPSVWRQTQETADAFTVAGRFVAIAGYEWTSQPKYWSGFHGDTPSEKLFEGPPRYYNHKNAYFPGPIPYLCSAKDEAFRTPDQVARAVGRVGGLIQNNHPSQGLDGRDQWDYSPESARVIRNTEIDADVVWYDGKKYETGVESVVRDYLNGGGRTGFVKGTDTHEGHPAARTAVLARVLTRTAIFDALRRRHCYAVTRNRIRLDFRINGYRMGEEVVIEDKPEIRIQVRGTDLLREVDLIRDGKVLRTWNAQSDRLRVAFQDALFQSGSYYYVRVTQMNTDEHGNASRAWSSPIWVRKRRIE